MNQLSLFDDKSLYNNSFKFNSSKRVIDIRESGRSSDYMIPDLVANCIADCQYCYMRRNKEFGYLDIASNPKEILFETLKHRQTLGAKIANQVDERFWTYDIGCNNDFSISANYIDWKYVFNIAKNNDLKFTFATKFVNNKLLTYNPKGKIRIRFSLQPFNLESLEKGTNSIKNRIKAMENFYNNGYEVHINFSPVIVTNTWLYDYKFLLIYLNNNLSKEFKEQCKLEVIFLTHNAKLHIKRLEEELDEDLLWTPQNQITKISNYGGENIRYKNKHIYIEQFKNLIREHFDLPIRYIF
jgi:spore photoproduct lyase